MIVVDNVYKRYQTDRGPGHWVLNGVNLEIPAKANVGLIGRNGAGKSTLLRLIGGSDQPTSGRIERHCRVSWPMGAGAGLQGSLSGRQNVKFVCRMLGREEEIADRIAFIEDFADIGKFFDEPIKTYSSGMKSRLQFGLSLAFEFDMYISDEVTAAGDITFKNKAAAAFRRLLNKSGLIMVAHSENTLKKFCQSGILLVNGQATWFDDVDDAFKAYQESNRNERKA